MPRLCILLAVLCALAACSGPDRAPPITPREQRQQIQPETPRTPPRLPPPVIEPAPPEPAAPEPAAPAELFPGVRADLHRKFVEFDGIVPIDAHHPETPHVFLEVFVCVPDTKEHESLVMTRALPANIHAALLAIGLEPGIPGSWRWEGEELIPIPPTGQPVTVTFIHTTPEGERTEAPAQSWVINLEGARLPAEEGFVFAGSRIRFPTGKQIYEANMTGTLVGLATFGTETIAWKRLINPDSQVDEPEWIADPKRIPRMGTPVTVRIQAASPPAPAAP